MTALGADCRLRGDVAGVLRAGHHASGHGRAPVPQGSPYYVAHRSRWAAPAPGDAGRFQSAFEQAMESGLVTDAAVAQSQAEVAAIWALRDERDADRGGWGLPFAFDVSLPIPTAGLRRARQAELRAPGRRCAPSCSGTWARQPAPVISPDGLPADARPASSASSMHRCKLGGAVRRARYRAGEESLVAAVAQPGRDRTDAHPQAGAGPEGHTQPGRVF